MKKNDMVWTMLWKRRDSGEGVRRQLKHDGGRRRKSRVDENKLGLASVKNPIKRVLPFLLLLQLLFTVYDRDQDSLICCFKYHVHVHGH